MAGRGTYGNLGTQGRLRIRLVGRGWECWTLPAPAHQRPEKKVLVSAVPAKVLLKSTCGQQMAESRPRVGWLCRPIAGAIEVQAIVAVNNALLVALTTT